MIISIIARHNGKTAHLIERERTTPKNPNTIKIIPKIINIVLVIIPLSYLFNKT